VFPCAIEGANETAAPAMAMLAPRRSCAKQA
jgi:hypothetical protein